MIGSESSPGLKYELNYGMIGNRGDEMRLDKYLKVARILKRRTVSKDLADHQRVLINGKVAKPASEVQGRRSDHRDFRPASADGARDGNRSVYPQGRRGFDVRSRRGKAR